MCNPLQTLSLLPVGSDGAGRAQPPTAVIVTAKTLFPQPCCLCSDLIPENGAAAVLQSPGEPVDGSLPRHNPEAVMCVWCGRKEPGQLRLELMNHLLARFAEVEAQTAAVPHADGPRHWHRLDDVAGMMLDLAGLAGALSGVIEMATEAVA